MLAKLIKYDLKSLNRFLIIIHIMLLVTAVLGRVLVVGRLMKNSDTISDAGAIILGIIILLFVLMFMVAAFGTLVLVGMHFYKNLFSDEGYLTHTLPVTRGELLASKTVSGSIWILIDEILLILSVVILIFVDPVVELFSEHKSEIWSALDLPDTLGYGKILLALLALCVISAVGSALTLYVSVALGQLFSNHRALGAVIVYFCVTTVVSIISGVVGAADGAAGIVVENGTVMLYQFYVRLFWMAIGFELVPIVIFYLVTYILMQKKLNLN